LIENSFCVDRKEQVLRYNDRSLSINSARLDVLGVTDGSTVLLSPSTFSVRISLPCGSGGSTGSGGGGGGAGSGNVGVGVGVGVGGGGGGGGSGRSVMIRGVSSLTLIKDVKHSVEMLSGIAVQQQRLNFLESRDLDDMASLFDCGVTRGSFLFLTLWPEWDKVHAAVCCGDVHECMLELETHDRLAAECRTPSEAWTAAHRVWGQGNGPREEEQTGAARGGNNHDARSTRRKGGSLGWAALFHAAFLGDVDMCIALMRRGERPGSHAPACEINVDVLRRPGSAVTPSAAVDGSGRTPLHAAATKGHAACVAAMISHGTEFAAADWSGVTADVAAKRAGHVGCAEAISSASWLARLATRKHEARQHAIA
jgi:hypothetical protein